jgi:hypothetical protein
MVKGQEAQRGVFIVSDENGSKTGNGNRCVVARLLGKMGLRVVVKAQQRHQQIFSPLRRSAQPVIVG